MPRTIQEQIKDLENTRASKLARQNEILAKANEEGRSTDAAESEEFDTLQSEIDLVDGDLKRYRVVEKNNIAGAKAITPGNGKDEKSGSDARSPRITIVEPKLDKGIAFARFVGCLAAGRGSYSDAMAFAKGRFGNDQKLHQVLELVGRMNGDRLMKAAVDVGTTTDSDFAAPLVNYTVMANEFIEFLRPQTIIGRIPGLRMVPFNIRIPRQTAGATAQWVGEGRPKPVGKQSFDYVTLAYMKLAIITAITEELARFSQPNAETLIRDDLAKAVIQQMDNDFIEPDNAGTANIKPASITYGITPIQSTGSTEAAITADVKAVFKAFTDANLDPSDAVWLMHTQTALGLSMVRNALGQRPIGFEGIGINGGTFFGLPVVASTNPGFTPDGSPTEKVLALVKASDILLADDGQVTIDTSREASIQMDSAPTYPADATTVLTSLWQHNLLGIKAERYITWVRARDSSVVLLENVGWGG